MGMITDIDTQQWVYNLYDCVRTWEVGEKMIGQVGRMEKGWPQLPTISSFQQSLFWPVLWAMERGVRVDVVRRGKVAGELRKRIKEMEEELVEMVGHPLNINSNKQMKEFFLL